MAGRPRTMARRVEQLLERQSALDAELQQLMPKQYVDSTNDTLGECWQRAVEASSIAQEHRIDLWTILDWKADKTEARAAADRNAAVTLLPVDNSAAGDSEPVVAESPGASSRSLDSGDMVTVPQSAS